MSVRGMRFERRSSLPRSAICLLANAARERLSTILSTAADLRVSEPAIPDPLQWRAIAEGAHALRVRGSAGEGTLLIRQADAAVLAAAAFGEPAERHRTLSPLELEVVRRALRALAPALLLLCGRETSAPEPILDIEGYATYLELLVEAPARFRIGVALAEEPPVPSGPPLRIEDLLDVRLEVRVQFAAGRMEAGRMLRLRPGTDVPMKTRMGEPGLLLAGSAVLARGHCGALGERSALIVAGNPQ